MIKLTSLQDEYAYLLTDDYRDLIFRLNTLQQVTRSLHFCHNDKFFPGIRE